MKITPFDLQAVVDAAKVGKYERKTSRPRDRLYASELGSCARAVWSNWRRPRPHDAEFERGRGMLGHAGEWVMKQHLAPIFLAEEVSFTNHRVSGRADFFIRIDGEQIPVEVKTTYAFDLSLGKPYPSHILQAAFYAMADDDPYALVVYLSLGNWGGNSGKWAALKVPRMDESLNARIDVLWDVVHNDEEPKCEKPEDCFECGLLGTEKRP